MNTKNAPTEWLIMARELVERGEDRQAAEIYRRILQVEPNCLEACYSLGVILQKVGQHEIAAGCFQRAIKVAPRFADAYRRLARSHQALGDFKRALACCRQAVELEPASAAAHLHLAQSLRSLDWLDDAADHYRIALTLSSNLAAAHGGLAETIVLLDDRSLFDEALRNAQKAVELEPANVEWQLKLAQVLRLRGETVAAEEVCRKLIQANPRKNGARFLLSSMGAEDGRLADSLAPLREAFAVAKDSEPKFASKILAAAYTRLVSIQRGRLEPADFEGLRCCLEAEPPESPQRAALLLALAQVHDACGDFSLAADCLLEAQDLQRRAGSRYRPDVETWITDAIVNDWSPARWERLRRWGSDSQRPVFIVGLPRSGTTLTEQIIAAHPQASGAGELKMIARLFDRLPRTVGLPLSPPQCIDQLERNHIEAMAATVLCELASIDPSAERVVDKMPDNYHHLGLIASLFPHARFVHCRRDIRDVALSIWMNQFEAMEWTKDIEHISRRIRDYFRTMSHWRSLGIPLLEIDYADLVEDFEVTARRLIDWTGLPWHDDCLAFYAGNRTVRTASFAQIRQPVYRSSLSRWKPYERILGPVLDILAEEQSAAA